jgi:CRISPR-associated endonuclease/helicase Cas3
LNANDRTQSDSDVFFLKHYPSLTGDKPFPWQRKLFAEFMEGTPRFRAHCPVPTGLGKTSVLTIWLLALAYRAMNDKLAKFPRRLAYVVNRRTVVDQATTEAEKLRAALTSKVELHDIAGALRQLATEELDKDSDPLAISTLRGELADNGEWRSDPARPAIVIGTVDMIGSRLLFSGYGRCGFKSRPLHAGLLGQDTLLVHDEAHLEPAFQKLLESIQSEQKRRERFGTDWDKRALHVMALTATTRAAGETPGGPHEEDSLFADEDRNHPEAGKRLNAKKWLAFHPVQDEKHIAEKIVERSMTFSDSGKAVLVFLRRLEDVEKVAADLRKKNPDAVQTLSGTLRGFERDRLAKDDEIFARFLPVKDRRVQPKEGTVYLVCTSAGEVGVNLSADHLVCDLTPLDSMVQRFGRVNRFGDGEARIELVHVGKVSSSSKAQDEANAGEAETESDGAGEGAGEPDSTAAGESKGKKKKPPSAFDLACRKTLDVLKHRLQKDRDSKDRAGRNASPAALSEMLSHLSPEERDAAFTPPPVIQPATDILFDAWAMTTVRGKLPGRPPVADYLHGVREWEPPETYVAWREEVSIVTGELLESAPPEELLEDYPLKPHELLRDRTDRVFKHLETISKRAPDLPVWLLSRDDDLEVTTLARLVEDGQKRLEGATIILPPAAGGLTESGMLDGNAGPVEDSSIAYDIADEWRDTEGQPRRQRVWGEAYKPPGMRLVRRIDLPAEAGAEDELEPEISSWFWYTRPRSADDDGSRVARQAQELEIHLDWTGKFACRLTKKLFSDNERNLAKAVELAARWHDLGKNRRIWQRSIGNHDVNRILAKSGPGMKPLENLTRYRHEFGSLLDITKVTEFQALDEDAKALVLHLIAAHHGRARPHFPIEEAFDPGRALSDVQKVASQVPQRFGRLQRRYGRWGLAWLESLVRAADAMASSAIQESGMSEDTESVQSQERTS